MPLVCLVWNTFWHGGWSSEKISQAPRPMRNMNNVFMVNKHLNNLYSFSLFCFDLNVRFPSHITSRRIYFVAYTEFQFTWKKRVRLQVHTQTNTQIHKKQRPWPFKLILIAFNRAFQKSARFWKTNNASHPSIQAATL